MSLFVGEPPRTKAVNGVLLAVLLGLLALPVLGGVLFLQGIADASADDGSLFDAVTDGVVGDGLNPLPFAALAGHEVARVCVASGIGAIRDMAASAGIAEAELPPGNVLEGTTAILMIGGGQVSYGDIRAEIFSDRYGRVSTSRPLCQDGTALAVVFETASPPRGGRVIDLAITDPAIFIQGTGPL